ncbi:MAG: PLD nuclease N-terminal domain-containing protein [Micrococcales bacterium]
MRLLVFGVVVVVVFTVFVTAFAAAADKNAVRSLPKSLWVLLCLFVPPIGGVLYLAVGRPVAGQTSTTQDAASYFRRMADRLRDRNDDR